jgi:hypothetical protein
VETPLLKRTAASITPAEAGRADPAAGYHDDRRPPHHYRGPLDHDDAPICTATAIRAAMEAGAASAGGVGSTEARDGTGNQNCCKKVSHVFS